MFIRSAWYVAAWAQDVKDRPFARRILGEPVVLFRDSAGKVGCLEDRCCHRGYPLSRGEIVDDHLQCGYHGLEFDLTGRCVRIPGQQGVPPAYRVKNYPVEEQDALIWVWMGDPSGADVSRIPRFAYHTEWPTRTTTRHIKCNYRRMIENLMDLSHFAYLHKATVGGNVASHVNAEMTVTPTERGVKFVRWMLDSPPPPMHQKVLNYKGNVDRWLEMELVAPSATLQYAGSVDAGTGAYDLGKRDGGFSLRLFHGITPETEGSTLYYFSVCTGFPQDDSSMTDRIYKDAETTIDEDVVALEAQDQRLRETGQGSLLAIRSDAARIHADKVLDHLLSEDAQAARRAVPEAQA